MKTATCSSDLHLQLALKQKDLLALLASHTHSCDTQL